MLCAAALCACGSRKQPDSEARLLDSWAGDGSTSPRAPLVIPADAPKVVFLGDSMSAGLHLEEDQAFPAAAQRLLADQGHPFQLVNAGVSGDTTAGGVARLDWLLKQEPQVVVVELGANDGLRGLALEDIERNLRALLLRIRRAGVVPLLLCMHIPTSYGEDYTRGFSAIYSRLARELDVSCVPEFLDGVGGLRDMNLPDGIHPNPRGHEKLAENLAGELRAVLERL